MKIPTDRPTIETELATFWMDDGILVSLSKPPLRTIENATENFKAAMQLSGGKKVCHLVYLSKSGIPDKATREFVNANLPKHYKAMAMISKPGLGKLIMNVLFGLNAPVIPMKTFSDEAKAREWLKQFM